MREIFQEIFIDQPLDPVEAARRSARPNLRRRFYKSAHADQSGTVLLDDRPVNTPARRRLSAPTRTLAEAIAEEWNAQGELIDPARMPITRLANVVIDGVTDAPHTVIDEIEKYLRSDLLFYRAEGPIALAERQSRAWDPILAWARDRFGARFILAEGIMYVTQPRAAISSIRQAVPIEPWRLGAVSSMTNLTGSALLALAIVHRILDPDAAWQAAHLDEDWQMLQWGRDELALKQRSYREAEFRAAATVLRLVD
ncbi:MAG TPA: ATP12 family protein [Pseudolabrys sp.]|nr:ATP12 family protein [Pseudolabrys sp.]